jgi:Ca2+-transporting ATPase
MLLGDHARMQHRVLSPSSQPVPDTLPPYQRSAVTVLQQLRVQPAQGLSSAEAARRQHKHGPNVIPRATKRHWLVIFVDRFRDLMVLCLVAAAGVSLMLGEIIDAIFIGIAIFFDTSLSALQVWRTQRILRGLQEHVQPTALVLRGGHLRRVPAESLVVGDILEFRAGERVPADARLLQTSGLRIDESPLTGESTEVHKNPATLESRTPLANRLNMAFLGTTVTAGSGRAVVTACGTRTEFGRIAQILKTERSPDSPLRRQLQVTSKWIAAIALALVVLVAGGSVALGASVAESLRTSLTLLVSAIPEDLTLILTAALAVGMVRIMRHRGILQELSAGETLGVTTVICTDKTGTITEGKMTALVFDFLQGSSLPAPTKDAAAPRLEPWQQPAFLSLALANDAHRTSTTRAQYVGATTERVALAFAESVGFNQKTLRQTWRQRDAISFNPRWKYRASLYDHPTSPTRTIFVNGAPETLLTRSRLALNEQGESVALTPARRAELMQRITAAARQGQRLLATAVRTNSTLTSLTHQDVAGLTFMGIVTISDPLRPEIPAAIHQAQQAGVAVKLITGDHAATALAIARQSGLAANEDTLCTGAQLEGMNDAELTRAINQITVFARVTALDKQRIIRALQQQGHVVAMTGDGVNDAVALKGADIGVAMASGKDIAKDAADLVLLDNNFATIVAAIREGRVIRDNVRKVLAFLLSTNTAEVALFILSFVTGFPLPLLPTQILWINMVTDGTSDLALALEPQERNVMKRRPEPQQVGLLPRRLVQHIGYSGLIMTAAAFALFWYLWQYRGEEITYVRTMLFTFLATTSLLSTWSFRSLWESILTRGFFANPWLIASTGFSFVLQLAALYVPSLQRIFGTVPLQPIDWALLLMVAVISVILIEARKIFFKEKATPYGRLAAARSAG